MTVGAKDVVATLLTGLVVVTFFATHQAWDVWLVGDSRRWAAGVIAVLGIATCGLGSPDKGQAAKMLAALGIAALALTILALATGSLTPLSLLVVDIVLLWVGSTARHLAHAGGHSVQT